VTGSAPQAHHRIVKPLWIRLWHWANALLVVVQAVSGASLHFAGPKSKLVEFSLAFYIHLIGGALLIMLFSSFVYHCVSTGFWRRFLPRFPTLVERCTAQSRYYIWGIFKGEHLTYSSPYALQSLAYFLILFLLMPAVALTGLLFLFPGAAPAQAFGWNGLLPLALAHYVTATLIVGLMIGHVYLGTLRQSATSSLRTMVTGRQHD
jgi:thiosulfate reductase cytochrome b subunit